MNLPGQERIVLPSQDVIDLLRRLIALDSRNPFSIEKQNAGDPRTWKLGGNELRVAEYLETLLKQIGFKVERQAVHVTPSGETMYNLLAEKGSGAHAILFYGHMDTVTARPWKDAHEALTPRSAKMQHRGIACDVLVGLGANDMKAGIAAIISALQNLKPEGYKIKIAFGVDEEFYSLGGNALARSSFLDDVRAIVVPEIGDGPHSGHGAHSIGIGRLGRGEFVIRVPGTGGHGAHSRNPSFVNAATECATIICTLEEKRMQHHDQFKFHGDTVIEGSFFVSRIEAGDGSLSVPASGTIVVDWTCTPNYTLGQALLFLQNTLDELYRAKFLREVPISGTIMRATVEQRLRPTPASNAYFISPSHLFTKYAEKMIDETVGFKGYNFGYSVADENVFAREHPEIPVLVIGPLGENSHKADEWVSIESVHELTRVYQTLASNFPSYISSLES